MHGNPTKGLNKKEIGEPPEGSKKDGGEFKLVKGSKKLRSPTPPDDASTKNFKTFEVETTNKYDPLDAPQSQQENEDDTRVIVENHNVVRPPPPVIIDNVQQSNQLLKLQDITKQNLRGRIIGKGRIVYPEIPEAYHAIRRYVDAEKLEAFTYQLDNEK
ncbi:hypothetical protein TNIN_192951, partial [Trichonephila inaurata madagascariensis]